MARLRGSQIWPESSLIANALECTNVKPVSSGHSKIDKTTILMTNGSVMKVESAFDLH